MYVGVEVGQRFSLERHNSIHQYGFLNAISDDFKKVKKIKHCVSRLLIWRQNSYK